MHVSETKKYDTYYTYKIEANLEFLPWLKTHTRDYKCTVSSSDGVDDRSKLPPPKKIKELSRIQVEVKKEIVRKVR